MLQHSNSCRLHTARASLVCCVCANKGEAAWKTRTGLTGQCDVLYIRSRPTGATQRGRNERQVSLASGADVISTRRAVRDRRTRKNNILDVSSVVELNGLEVLHILESHCVRSHRKVVGVGDPARVAVRGLEDYIIHDKLYEVPAIRAFCGA